MFVLGAAVGRCSRLPGDAVHPACFRFPTCISESESPAPRLRGQQGRQTGGRGAGLRLKQRPWGRCLSRRWSGLRIPARCGPRMARCAYSGAIPSSAYASVNGLQMYYEVHGSGPPLVLLHGGALTIGLSFGPMIPALAETHQVIAVEMQGHGHTADIDREMTPASFADDVVTLLGQLGIEQADLLGYSRTGCVSLEIVTRHPHLVGRLVLASTPTCRTDFALDGHSPPTECRRPPMGKNGSQSTDGSRLILDAQQ